MISETDKKQVRSKIENLRRSEKAEDKETLHVVTDLTATQRQEGKVLLDELERRRGIEEDDLVIRNRKIIKRPVRGRGEHSVAQQ